MPHAVFQKSWQNCILAPLLGGWCPSYRNPGSALLAFPKYNLSIYIVHSLKALDSTAFVYKYLVTCDLLRVTEYHCCQGTWQQDSTWCSICLLYHL